MAEHGGELSAGAPRLSVIIELINTVETNDVVTVASMTRPKPLPNEAMSDLAVNMENAVNAGDMENAESAVNMENAESGCLYIFL
ncbi:hypothetical protein PS2_013869 [Malus domestica]